MCHGNQSENGGWTSHASVSVLRGASLRPSENPTSREMRDRSERNSIVMSGRAVSISKLFLRSAVESASVSMRLDELQIDVYPK